MRIAIVDNSMLLLRNQAYKRILCRQFAKAASNSPSDQDAYAMSSTEMALVPKVEQNLTDLLSQLQPQRTKLEFSPEQRAIWDVIRAENNIMLSRSSQSGKSLGIAVMALNRALTHAPVRERRLLDSLIVVPTDALVEKYRFYFSKLLHELPAQCCPFREDQNSEFQYESFTAEFVDSKGISSKLSTGDIRIPQVVVSTPSGLLSRLNTDGDNFGTTRLIALDDFDFMVSSTGFGPHNENFYQLKTSGKLRSRAVDAVKQIYKVHRQTFVRKLESRLRDVESRYTKSDVCPATKYVMSQTVAEGKAETSPRSFNQTLMERLFSLRNRLIYKPPQFCIVSESMPPLSGSLGGHSKTKELAQHLVDLSGNQKNYHFKQRKLVCVDEFNLEEHVSWADQIAGQPPTVYVGSAVSKAGYRKSKIKSVESPYLDGGSAHARLKWLSEYCSNDKQKKFLSKRNPAVLSKSHVGYEVLIERTLSKFHSLNTSTAPFLIVVPPSVDLEKLCTKEGLEINLKAFVNNESVEVSEHIMENQKSHLCIHPHHLVGHTFQGTQNIMILGLDCLLAATAFEAKPNPKALLGLTNPNLDLLGFYLKKLLASRTASEPANLVILRDDIVPGKNSISPELPEADNKKFEQILMTTDLRSICPVKRI